MVYETDFYTTRRPYRASPSLSTYTLTSSSPRHYPVRDSPERSRRSETSYTSSYTSSTERSSSSNDPYSYRPTTRSYTTSETVNRSTGSGPGGYSYSSDRTSRSSGDGPGGYSSSYSSTSSGRLPGGTSYRHYSYRV
ncbi:protein anoxia up-regulated-like isoform X2 [Atheta coriaria]|uniref:protein anoxia up-regulated-like isoform X2 n=1 Tax=Dalotia coriaria TaxID=877792 RepID=UPI0031F45FE5